MKILNIFIDESGDFGEYAYHAPYYIVLLVFHDNLVDISDNISQLNMKIKDSGLPDYTIHTGPLNGQEFYTQTSTSTFYCRECITVIK